eukprot:gnl/MRDRNA2_/MRDRNA2_94235_c0_seq1.p1 gnl/MRDRNA2_/MRDRNA2_94235_c0~~gnl/MRDRNA2_/MRDRNA2_94235_c0_seq1.p1  ORF type:complete len:1077 (+),score=291.59 gnl/MRDRNA2_/MRDRNA2_94235_c0_seq1:120-3350(+)
MLKLDPQPSSAKPPVPPTKTRSETGGPVGGTWTVTEPAAKLGKQVSGIKRKVSQQKDSIKAVNKANTASATSLATAATSTTREPLSPKEPTSPRGPTSPKGAAEDTEDKKTNSTRVRTVENWLNDALEGTDENGSRKNGGGGAKQGLMQYNIDASTLDGLGLDPVQTERIHRALMVYSQGIHLLLNDAVNCTRHRSQALLILWKAFTAVLEHAAPGEKQGGGESFAELMQKGNADQVAQVELHFKSLIKDLEHKNSILANERREGQVEIENLKGDTQRLENQIHMYQNDNEITLNKYELEIRQRMSAEARYLEKLHWAGALQEDLDKAKAQVVHLSKNNDESNESREELLVQVDDLKTRLRSFEVTTQEHQQQALETAQQKIRFENQIDVMTNTNERNQIKIKELKAELVAEIEKTKGHDAQMTLATREHRKIETAYEDEVFARKELQKIADDLQTRLDATDKALNKEIEDGRRLQKEVSDLRLKQRTDEVELKRKREQLAELQKDTQRLKSDHSTLTEEHRTLKVECEYLREDVSTLDEQLKKEGDNRKLLQLDKKRLMAELESCISERDTAKTAAAMANKEMIELTKKMMKMESIVRQCEQAKSKLELEHAVERRSHAKRIALLEKVIFDERDARRELVGETQETTEQMDNYHAKLKQMQEVMEELKSQRRDAEEEADRHKLLVLAQERRTEELLILVDRQHAATANHDSEMRQMQVVLECEREEAKRQMDEMHSAFAKGRYIMEQRIDAWQMRFEDALSLLHFNPATQKIQKLQQQNQELEKELQEGRESMAKQIELVAQREEELLAASRKTEKMQEEVKLYRQRWNDSNDRYDGLLEDYEKRSLGMADMEMQADRLSDQMSNFDAEREALEDRIQQLLKDKKQVVALLNKVKHDGSCQVNPRTKTEGQQTDLSYQYLESEKKMNEGPRRQEQLHTIRKAGHYVDHDGHHSNFHLGQDGPNNGGMTQMHFAVPQQQYSVGSGQQTRGGLVFSKPQGMPVKKPAASQPPSRVSTTAGSARPTTRGTLGTAGSGTRRVSTSSAAINAVPTIEVQKAPGGFTPEPWDEEEYGYDYE